LAERSGGLADLSAQQALDKGSILNFYRKLIALRKAETILVYGQYDLLLEKTRKFTLIPAA